MSVRFRIPRFSSVFQQKNFKQLLNLLLIGFGIIFVLVVVYQLLLFVGNSPQEVRVTNVGSNSMTISWTTRNKDVGTVLYSSDPNFQWIPAPISFLFAQRAYDDRDYNQAQLEMAAAAANAANQGSVNSISEVSVTKQGQYFVHHVTLRNLQHNSRYYFSIGNNYLTYGFRFNSYKDTNNQEFNFALKHFDILTMPENNTLITPNPSYGSIYEKSGAPLKDAFVISYLVNSKQPDSILSTPLSSIVGEEGTFYIDLANFRTFLGSEQMDPDESEDIIQFFEVFDKNGARKIFSTSMLQNAPTPDFYIDDSNLPASSLKPTEVLKDTYLTTLEKAVSESIDPFTKPVLAYVSQNGGGGTPCRCYNGKYWNGNSIDPAITQCGSSQQYCGMDGKYQCGYNGQWQKVGTCSLSPGTPIPTPTQQPPPNTPCRCTGGKLANGTPIDPATTRCTSGGTQGTVVCGQPNTIYECTSSGWQAKGQCSAPPTCPSDKPVQINTPTSASCVRRSDNQVWCCPNTITTTVPPTAAPTPTSVGCDNRGGCIGGANGSTCVANWTVGTRTYAGQTCYQCQNGYWNTINDPALCQIPVQNQCPSGTTYTTSRPNDYAARCTGGANGFEGTSSSGNRFSYWCCGAALVPNCPTNVSLGSSNLPCRCNAQNVTYQSDAVGQRCITTTPTAAPTSTRPPSTPLPNCAVDVTLTSSTQYPCHCVSNNSDIYTPGSRCPSTVQKVFCSQYQNYAVGTCSNIPCAIGRVCAQRSLIGAVSGDGKQCRQANRTDVDSIGDCCPSGMVLNAAGNTCIAPTPTATLPTGGECTGASYCLSAGNNPPEGMTCRATSTQGCGSCCTKIIAPDQYPSLRQCDGQDRYATLNATQYIRISTAGSGDGFDTCKALSSSARNGAFHYELQVVCRQPNNTYTLGDGTKVCAASQPDPYGYLPACSQAQLNQEFQISSGVIADGSFGQCRSGSGGQSRRVYFCGGGFPYVDQSNSTAYCQSKVACQYNLNNLLTPAQAASSFDSVSGFSQCQLRGTDYLECNGNIVDAGRSRMCTNNRPVTTIGATATATPGGTTPAAMNKDFFGQLADALGFGKAKEIIAIKPVQAATAYSATAVFKVDDKYIVFQQDGKYKFTVNGKVYTVDATTTNKYHVYLDENANGVKDGNEKFIDEITNISQLQISTTTKNYTYVFKPGYNFVSFAFIPVEEQSMASKFMTYLKSKGEFSLVSYYDGGWVTLSSFKEGKEFTSVSDFAILPGKGYVVRLLQDTPVTVTFTGFPLVEPTKNSLVRGWNLLGFYNPEKAYTALSLATAMNNKGDIKAVNISKFDDALYSGLQIEDEKTYGFDFPIDSGKGYFVNIRNLTGDTNGKKEWQDK